MKMTTLQEVIVGLIWFTTMTYTVVLHSKKRLKQTVYIKSFHWSSTVITLINQCLFLLYMMIWTQLTIWYMCILIRKTLIN